MSAFRKGLGRRDAHFFNPMFPPPDSPPVFGPFQRPYINNSRGPLCFSVAALEQSSERVPELPTDLQTHRFGFA